jgi:hypothetical protein
MVLKPLGGEACDLVEGSRFFEEMCRARHNAQGFCALQLGIGRFVALEHHLITATDNEQCWGQHLGHEVKAVDRARWPVTLVSEVMRPLAQLRTVTPDTAVTEALEILGHNDINQVPVVANRRLVGMLSRDHILRYLLTRAELHM